MILNENDLYKTIELVTRKTGIIPRESHKAGIKSYVEKRLDTLNETAFSNYYMILQNRQEEFLQLINESTVNETYFFREEKQFSFLKDKFFPNFLAKTGGAEMNIWCAACSTGEEAYSLAMLSKYCHVRANITASDINTNVMEICNKGFYKASSCRTVDGGSFNFILDAYKQKDGSFQMSDDVRAMVKTRQINLSKLNHPDTMFSLPRNQHLIFIRNVFIYFCMDLRAEILKTIADVSLADDGLLFVSMNEVASLDDKIVPPNMERISDGPVFCFHKKSK